MYIVPNSTIKLLANCPLDTSYNHTIYFASLSAQYTYFTSIAAKTYNNYTYQRVNNNTIRVQSAADDLYNCNYMMFQNSAFGNKWFYAFVNEINYINNSVTEIVYALDYIQTYWFDIELGNSFVEREHSAVDYIGSNLIDDNIPVHEYVYTGLGGTDHLTQMRIVIASPWTENTVAYHGGFWSGQYSALKYYDYPNTAAGAEQARSQMAVWGNRAFDVVAAYLAPADLLSVEGATQPKVYTVDKTPTYSSVNGYYPKNLKLYTYPYYFIKVSNNHGNYATYRYELFADKNNVQFSLTGTTCVNSQVTLIPLDYKGLPSSLDDRLDMPSYGQLALASDSFREWMTNAGIQITSAVLSAAVTAFAPNPATGAIALSTVSSLIGSGVQAAMAPPQMRGNMNGNLLDTIRATDYSFIQMECQAAQAKSIDDYWTMYGYPCKQIKIPNVSSRPHWNYTKTVGCVIHGKAPAVAEKEICRIFDRGITFWKNPEEIGDYTLDNAPTSAS